MKEKKTLIYGILAAIIVSGGSSYAAYRLTYRHLDDMQIDYENRVSEQIQINVQKELEKQAAEVVQKTMAEKEEAVAASQENDTLSVDTVYAIEKYDVQNDVTVTEYETLPEELVGFTREDAEVYCQEYMDALPVEEYLDGLQSMGVTDFSKDCITIKKIYDASKVKYRYYLIALDGEVVVYYGDKKTVYEYTGIEADKLSKKERGQLKKGIEVEDENALFSILENYSS